MKEFCKYLLEILGILFISAGYTMYLWGASFFGSSITSFIGMILYMLGRRSKVKKKEKATQRSEIALPIKNN